MKDQIEMLEKTILDLGAEVFKLKHALVSMTLRQSAINKLVDGLKIMLDEKGLITAEEVEEAALMKGLIDKTPAAEMESEEDQLLAKKGVGH